MVRPPFVPGSSHKWLRLLTNNFKDLCRFTLRTESTCRGRLYETRLYDCVWYHVWRLYRTQHWWDNKDLLQEAEWTLVTDNIISSLGTPDQNQYWLGRAQKSSTTNWQTAGEKSRRPFTSHPSLNRDRDTIRAANKCFHYWLICQLIN